MAEDDASPSGGVLGPGSPFPDARPEDLIAFSLNTRQLTLLAAGMATLLATQICLNVVQEHVKHWKRPREQRAIIVILFLVPIFAVDSYIGLADMPGSEVTITVLDSIRACYEAYVISEFLVLLYSYMDVSTGFKSTVPDTVKGKVLHHSFPLTLVLGEKMIVDRKALNLLYGLSRQFIIVRPIFSTITCILLLLDCYHVGIVPWVFLIVFNVSMYLAFYSLLLFYHAFEHRLQPHKPLAKFLSIKAVVFLVFWQGLIVKILVAYGIIHPGHMPYEVRQVEEAVQNFVVCIEMFLASFLFRYAYSAGEYEHLVAEPAEKQKSTSSASRDVGPTKPPEASKDQTSTEDKKEK